MAININASLNTGQWITDGFTAPAGSSYTDEFRWSNTVRSADWIATEYNNQNSPSTSLNVGQQ